MKGALLFLGFIIYNIWLFWLEDWRIFAGLLLLDLCMLLLLWRHHWRRQVRFLAQNYGFVAFVILCNWLFSGLPQALLLGMRLGLAIEATYLVSQLLTPQEFARGIAGLCAPLRLFKVDTEAIVLSITVALTFVPLLTHEAKQLQSNLKLKGCGLRTLWRQPQIYIVGIMEQLFGSTEAAEQALRLKGYD